LCDAEMAKRTKTGTIIGMGEIKERRLSLPVKCHSGDKVGDYVPFYFCPRSYMLYVIYRANHPDLKYKGGQEPIIHLEADLKSVVEWAEKHNKRWAFTLSNAGAFYTEFRSRFDQLHELNWTSIFSSDFRSSEVKEGKQSEFLFHQFFPWKLFDRIGVLTPGIAQRVADMTRTSSHRPKIEILKDWYF